ncbi:MAG: PLP-dependent aminotransferase family protein [Candidatus Eremiobacteraeota bacterium]|jgi:GntR family transcriptional regulator/MocR family aminotransferase|nr:PLP-dependent aminotransferase family protein [Candidatus Eremiobacteraeota bacterium]
MTDPTGEFESLFPDRSSRLPIGRQLVERLRAAIHNGGLAEGTRLLPSRELAARIGVSRNTVVAAVEQLVAEGYLVARVGSGTFVARGMTRRSAAVAAPAPLLPPGARRHLDVAHAVAFAPGGLGAFRDGLPDLDAFPLAAWQRLERRARSLTARFAYADPAGDTRLRAALAQHLRQFRGLSLNDDEVLIVEGAQSGFTLIADVMLEPGDAVVCEDPSYAAARAAFTARGARVHGVPIDDDGLVADDAPPARLAYVTPSHQFPLGGVMSAARRASLLAWAQRHDAYIVEDDYDSEFRFNGGPLQAIQGSDASGRVIYVGTFSKVLAPGLRVGYVVAPPHLAPALRAARAVGSLGTSALTQAVLADFVREGFLARHVRRLNAEYQRRGEYLCELLRDRAGDRLTIGPLTGGMHVTVRIDPQHDDVAIAARARERRVFLHPLSDQCIARDDLRGFILGFGSTPREAMPDAVDVLVELLP